MSAEGWVQGPERLKLTLNKVLDKLKGQCGPGLPHCMVALSQRPRRGPILTAWTLHQPAEPRGNFCMGRVHGAREQGSGCTQQVFNNGDLVGWMNGLPCSVKNQLTGVEAPRPGPCRGGRTEARWGQPAAWVQTCSRVYQAGSSSHRVLDLPSVPPHPQSYYSHTTPAWPGSPWGRRSTCGWGLVGAACPGHPFATNGAEGDARLQHR